MDDFAAIRSPSSSPRWLTPILVGTLVCYLGTIAVITSAAIATHHAQVLAAIDRSLAVGTTLVHAGIPEDLLRRSLHENGITAAEHQTTNRRLTDIAADAGLTYLYVLVEDGDLLRLVLTSEKPEDLSSGNFTPPWQEYSEAPAAAHAMFTRPAAGPLFAEYEDRWGQFRSRFVPGQTADGSRYAVGADLDLTGVNQELTSSRNASLIVAIFLGTAGCGLVVMLQLFARRLERSRRGLLLLSQVAHVSSQGVAIADRSGKLHWHNDRWSRLIDAHADVESVFPGPHGHLQSIIRDRSGCVREVPGKDERWLRVDLQYAETVSAWILVLTDLTERRQLEQRLRSAHVSAEAAAEAKSNFLANMSHEIRTPMNGVLGMLELINASGLTPEQEEQAQIARRCGESLLGILNDVLDLAKIDSGQMSLEILPVDIHELAHDIGDLLRGRANQGVDLLIRIDPAAPTWAMTDPLRMRQILTNLLCNALKFTREGHVLLDISASETTAATETWEWEFRVQDTGIGIPADRVDQLFAPFTQIDTSISRRFGGTGLGLSISQRLAHLLGGTISVTSEENVGSTFTLTLRCEAAHPAEAIADAPSLPDLAGTRVLIVDDDATNRRILIEQLSRIGMACTAVPSAGVALVELGIAAGQGHPYHVLITDQCMPDMTGEELGRVIADDAGFGEPVRVLYTSVAIPQRENWLATSGFAGCLLKPARSRVLFETVARALHPHGRTTGSGSRPAQPKRRRQPRLLLVEDDRTCQLVAQGMLRGLDCQTTTVANGEEAITTWRNGHFDAVLMDCQMPVLDGFQATKKIRILEAELGRPRLPIIALTGNVMSPDRERCQLSGMDAHLAKPLTIDDLDRALRRWVPDESA